MPFASYPERCGATAQATWGDKQRARAAFVLAIVGISAGACARRQPPPRPLTGVVEGIVADPLGQGATDVMVELTTDPPDGRVPIAAAKTGTAGTFRMDGVPAGRYLLRARRRSFAGAAASVTVGEGAVRVELRLAALARLRGRIEDGHRTPIPLAHVLVFAVAEASAPTFHEARADANGHFSVDDLTAGAYRLLIEAPGLGTAAAGPVTAPDADVVVVIPGESRSVTGLVTRLGHPARGVRVHLGGESVSEPRMTETDIAGQFAFPGLGPGNYALRAESGALVSPVVADVIVGAASQVRQIDLVLDDAAFVRGRVVDDGGAGLSGALVRVDLIPATGLWSSVETDGTGSWISPPIPPGKYQLRPRRAGYTARRTVVVDVPPRNRAASSIAPASEAIALGLLRTGEIVGRIVAENGAPIAGAKVHDRPATIEELGVIATPLPAAAAAASAATGALAVGDGQFAARQAQSGADGRFVLTDVPPGRLRVEILHPSAVPFRGRPLVLPPGGRLDLGALILARAALLSGHVTDDAGLPLAGVRVAAGRTAAGGATDASLYAVTGSDGEFALPLAPGEHAVVATMQGRLDAEVVVHVTPDAIPRPVTLRFAKAGNRELSGVVKDTDGRPLAGARVSAFPGRAAAMPSTGPEASALGTATTDPGGHFRLSALPDAALRIEVGHPRYAPFAMDVEGAATPVAARTELVMSVPVPGGISGEVHESVTGGPVARFEIDAQGPAGATAHFPERGRRADPKRGPFHFVLAPLAPGAWILRARAPGYGPVDRQIVVPAAGTLGDASIRDVRLELRRGS